MSHPAVIDVAVVGVPTRSGASARRHSWCWGKGLQASAEDIVEHTRTLLAGYKVPRDIVFPLDLPRTPTARFSSSSYAPTTDADETWILASMTERSDVPGTDPAQFRVHVASQAIRLFSRTGTKPPPSSRSPLPPVCRVGRSSGSSAPRKT